MSEFQAKSDDFLDWFKSQSGATFDSRLQITDLRDRGAGRGIIATSDIPAETDLFVIPRKSVISVENSELSKKLPKIFTLLKNTGDDVEMADGDEDEELSMPDPWLDLIMVMIYEYLQGEKSAWKLYFEVLPDVFDTLMFWSENELDQLQASAVKEKVGKASADEMFNIKVLPVIKAHEDIFYANAAQKLSDEQIIQLAHRMGSVIMAYAFDLENEEDNEEDEQEGWVQDREGAMAMGMVPMADMLNADAEFNAHLNHGEETLTMTSLRTIKTGEEVLNYYGPLPNCDLLRRYGYTSEKHSRYDVVEIPWDVISSTIDKKFVGSKKGSLDEEEMEESFVLERDSGEPDDSGINTYPAKFTAFPEEMEDQVYQIIAPALGIDLNGRGPNKVQRKQLKYAFAEIMDQAIPARLAQYTTSVEQDEQLLNSEDVTGRQRMAVFTRLGEKKLLQEAKTIIPGLLEKYKPDEEEEEGPKTKRQKRSR